MKPCAFFSRIFKSAAATLFKTLGAGAKLAGRMIKGALISSGIGLIPIVILELLSWCIENIDFLKEKLISAMEKIKNFITPFSNFITNTLKTITTPIDKILEKIGVLKKEAKQTPIPNQPSTGLVDSIKTRQQELKNIYNSSQKQIIDNRHIEIHTTANANDIDRSLRANTYTYADLEE